jgi:outer membrane protein assembly factor BamE (lipoprotein component of BamABCDE complex)
MKMPRWFNVVTSALAAVALPACDYVNLQELKPGVSTAAEVRSRMGDPAQEYRNVDGSVTWEFNRQPNGIDCYMITIGPDQVVQRIEQVLTEANMGKVVVGMDRDEVRRLLGAPGSKTTYQNSREEVWDWRVAGMIPTEEAHFHVHFDPATGLVKRTSRRVEVRA